MGIDGSTRLNRIKELLQTVPFVRIPWTHPWQAKTVMDLGALGVCFPMTCTGEQAAQAVRAVPYPPEGDRF